MTNEGKPRKSQLPTLYKLFVRTSLLLKILTDFVIQYYYIEVI